ADSQEGWPAPDREALLLLATRFKKEVRQVLRQGTSTNRLAVLVMLAEMGPGIRTPEDQKGIGRAFGPDLAELLKQKNPPSIREAAARCLGQVFPDPDLAAASFDKLLRSGSVPERRAAATGLASLMGAGS